MGAKADQSVTWPAEERGNDSRSPTASHDPAVPTKGAMLPPRCLELQVHPRVTSLLQNGL